MKKLIRFTISAITLFTIVGGLLAPVVTFAAIEDINNPKDINQLMNTDLPTASTKGATGDVSVATLKIINKEITNTSAKFDFLLTAKKNTSFTSSMSFGRLATLLNVRDVLYINNFIKSGDTKKFSYTFTGLKDGNQYYFQPIDIPNTVNYQKIFFKTTGTAANDGKETTASIDDQKNALVLSLPEPTGKAITAAPNSKVNVRLKGSFITNLNMKVGLDFYIGEDPSDLKKTGQVFPATLVISDIETGIDYTQNGLDPETKYYYQIKETTKGFDATEVLSFTTPASDKRETTESPDAQKNALIITLPVPTTSSEPPTIISIADPARGPYSAVFKGTFSTNLNMRVGLDLYIGDSAGSMFKVSPPLFPPELVYAGDAPKTFSYAQSQLAPGTTYFYQIRESTKNFDATQVNQFTTPGTKNVDTDPFDPNQAGGIIDYEFPTDLGEPTGDDSAPITDAPTLVPCGKLSDQNDPKDKNCNFGHLGILIGNVIQFLLVLLIPLTVLMCVYTGVQMILHRKNPLDLAKYKSQLLRVGTGLAVMLLAWTIVATLMTTLLGDDAGKYLLLKIL
jgi:hypothetical protein